MYVADMKTCKLTIVIPVYNREKFLSRTLSSVSMQTYTDFHLVLVDNASSDASLRICQDFASQTFENSKMEVTVLRELRKGASFARNAGLCICNTPYVYFFDSDDEMSPDFVEKVTDLMNSDFDLMCFPVRQVQNGVEQKRFFQSYAAAYDHILNSMLSTQSMLFRTDFLRGVGGWNESLLTWDDWELGERILLHHPRVKWLPSFCFHRIYVHHESITGEGFSSRLEWLAKAMDAAVQNVHSLLKEGDERKKCLRALFYRYAILQGHLRAEKNMNGALECALQANRISVSWCEKCIWKALSCYVAHGGRGAWRMAKFLL